MSMSASDVVLAAHYYDGKSSRRLSAQLSWADSHFHLSGAWGSRSFTAAEVEIAEPLGQAPRLIRFADGAYCEVADLPAFAVLLQRAGQRDSLSVRLHRRWSLVGSALFGVGAIVVATYVWLLPALAGYLAPRVPDAVTTHLSQSALNSLDAHLLAPSALPAQREIEIRRHMAAFATQAGAPAYRLHFRAAPKAMPPNAFALPSGDIVIFDNLLTLLDDDEAIAVFAHELGHVAHHHGLRNMLQSAVVSTLVGLYLGDLSSAAAALAAASLEANYSQAFETEADSYGADLLKRGGSSPQALATALEKLERAAGDKKDSQPAREENWFTRLFSSHPSTVRRIDTLRQLAD